MNRVHVNWYFHNLSTKKLPLNDILELFFRACIIFVLFQFKLYVNLSSSWSLLLLDYTSVNSIKHADTVLTATNTMKLFQTSQYILPREVTSSCDYRCNPICKNCCYITCL